MQVEVSSPGEREPESVLCTSQSTPTEGGESVSEKDLQSTETTTTTQSTAVTDQSKINDINNRSTNETGKDAKKKKKHILFPLISDILTILTSHISLCNIPHYFFFVFKLYADNK